MSDQGLSIFDDDENDETTDETVEETDSKVDDGEATQVMPAVKQERRDAPASARQEAPAGGSTKQRAHRRPDAQHPGHASRDAAPGPRPPPPPPARRRRRPRPPPASRWCAAAATTRVRSTPGSAS